ncbi:MAG: hypothetical protein P1P65_00625 [Treponema sp.]
MKQLNELSIYILKQEFPQLSLTEDPDIERYFEFRTSNRQTEALRLYNTTLKRKYPDDTVRVLLMTYYRKRDYRFQLLLTDSLARLAEQTIEHVKKTIVFFAETIAPLKKAKVYTVIQVCEKVITAISPDRFAAIGFTEKYVRYAVKLQFRVKSMQEAADIIRMYITDTISSVREFREEHERKASEAQNRRSAPTAPSVVDFSKITFTKAQIAAITIPAGITRTEDKVLAYTLKYWDCYTDSAFENTLLLYSRKYGTHHYNVFQAVKIGRIRSWKDEEILHAVLAYVAQGYYYSITGDLYLQRTWKLIRLKAAQQQRLLPPPQKKNEQKKAIRQPKKKPEAAPRKPVPEPQSGKQESSPPVEDRHNAAVSVPAVPEAAVQPAAAPPKDKRQKQPVSAPFPPVQPVPAAAESIADMVKKSTGKTYGIYRDLFFKAVRPSIRVILQHSAVQKRLFFGTGQNAAENIIYDFLEDHYDNPYQQWQGSEEQAAVLKQGFRVESLEPIIRHWAAHNL